jgi:hypothetical protein
MGANTLEHAPPPPRSVLFAALTIASIASVVMSPRHMATFVRWTWQLAVGEVRPHTMAMCRAAYRRHPLLARRREGAGSRGFRHDTPMHAHRPLRSTCKVARPAPFRTLALNTAFGTTAAGGGPSESPMESSSLSACREDVVLCTRRCGTAGRMGGSLCTTVWLRTIAAADSLHGRMSCHCVASCWCEYLQSRRGCRRFPAETSAASRSATFFEKARLASLDLWASVEYADNARAIFGVGVGDGAEPALEARSAQLSSAWGSVLLPVAAVQANYDSRESIGRRRGGLGRRRRETLRGGMI